MKDGNLPSVLQLVKNLHHSQKQIVLKHLYCSLCLLWLSFSQIIIFCLFSRTLDTVLLQTGPESKLFSTASTGVRQSARVQSPVLRQIGSGSESFLTKFTPEKEDLFLMLRVKETLT